VSPASHVSKAGDGPTAGRGPSSDGRGESPVVVAEGVRKVYRGGADVVEALRGVDLVIERGAYVAVMGPSGSGKTTLLNCLSGLDDIDGGRVLVDGISIHDQPDHERTAHRAASMGFVFQAFNLISVFSAVENVELPLLLAGMAEREAHRPSELSGGEQQRVTLARALAGGPRIVWADEPTGNLDSETAGAVMVMLDELNREGLTVVLVTHDRTVAAHASRLVTMSDGHIVGDRRTRGRGARPARGGANPAARPSRRRRA
jgi:putative ABC transport system ATP-binding protein